MPLFPMEHSMSTGTFGTTTPSLRTRSLVWSSSRWTSLDPGAPLQYRSLISEVTSKPRPRAWIELQRVVDKASELKLLVVAADLDVVSELSIVEGLFIGGKQEETGDKMWSYGGCCWLWNSCFSEAAESVFVLGLFGTLLVGELCLRSKGRLLTVIMAQNAFFGCRGEGFLVDWSFSKFSDPCPKQEVQIIIPFEKSNIRNFAMILWPC